MYYCKNCGAEISANMRFCSACGTPAEMEAAPGDADRPVISSPKKVKLKIDSLPKFAVPALAVVAMAALVILAAGIFKLSKYDIEKGIVLCLGNSEDDTVIVIANGKNQVTLDGIPSYRAKSMDGTKAVLIVNDTGSPYSVDYEGYSLYYISDKVTLITDGVNKAKISASGNAIAFVKDYDKATEEGTLYLWNNGKTTLVSDSMLADMSFCISPDGKTVAFTSGTVDDYSGSCYNGHLSDLGKSVEPFAVADNARYIYYTKNSSGYVMLDNGDKQKLADDISRCHFNKDLSQMVYQANGKTYAIIKGKEKITLSGEIYSFILPDNTQNAVNIIGVKSFANTLYQSGDDIIRIDNKFEASSVAYKTGKFMYLASDGRTLIYMKNDDLYKVDALNNNATAVKLVDGNVIDFEAVNKGSAVYFLNEDKELYYQKGKDKPTHIADDVMSSSYPRRAIAVFKDKILYYVSDSEIYTATGKKGNLVSGIDDEADSVSATLYYVDISSADYGQDYEYFSIDGKTYIKIDKIPYGAR
jgi:hypothetical protein